MKKILIIEDDQLVANIYANKLASDDRSVETALDGETGYEKLKCLQPDLVLLDLMLPRISGVELLRKIRAQEEFKQLPIVVFSNTYLSNMVQDAWKAGATKCLSKANCSPKHVIDVIQGLLTTPAPAPPKAAEPDATPEPAAKESEADASQAKLRKSFLDSLPATLIVLRGLLQALVKSPDEAGRVAQLQELYRRVHALTGNAGIAGIQQIAQMADALEALLKELYEKPRNINVSTLRTVASAIDFLGALFDQGKNLTASNAPTPSNGTALVVDDEVISQRAVVHALEKTKMQSMKVQDPAAALELMAAKNFDLIFLDVDMPGMNGFELCAKLRGIPKHKTTPIIFVTGLTDFDSRAHSAMSGGNDLIAKPFLFMELAVKALIYLLRAKLPIAAR